MNQVKNKEEIAEILMRLIKMISERKIDDTNKQQFYEDINQIKKSIDRIAEIKIEEIKEELGNNYEEIEFSIYMENNTNLGKYTSNLALDQNTGTIKKVELNHKIKVNFNNILKLLTSNNTNIRKLCVVDMIDTIFHEFIHFKQNCLKQADIVNINVINSAKQDILARIKNNEVYMENYLNMSDEIDARLTAYDMIMEVLEILPNKESEELIKLYKSNAKIDVDEVSKNVSLFHEGREGREQDRETFFNQRVDIFIEEHPEVLEIYKPLQVEYNEDGTRKGNLQLIKALGRQIININKNENITQQEKRLEIQRLRNTYFDILADRLQDMTKDEAKEFEEIFGKEGRSGTQAFYNFMEQHYIEVYNQKINDLDKLQAMMEQNGEKRGFKNELEYQRQIIESKYARLIQTVINLSESRYQVENNIINGVELEYVAPTKISPEKQEIKDKTVSNFIKLYDNIETDEDFEIRQKLEDKNISQVLNAVNVQRCTKGFMLFFDLDENESFSEREIKKIMRALKAADALTVEGGRNYLRDFANVPFVNDVLAEMCKGQTLKTMVDKAKQKGNAKIYRTLADEDKIIANEHLKSQDLKREDAQKELKYYGRHYSENAHLVIGNSKWDRIKLAIWRITARQQGFRIEPLSKFDEKGTVRKVVLKKGESCLINLEDFNKFAISQKVMDCMVNGKTYKVIGTKDIEAQVQ